MIRAPLSFVFILTLVTLSYGYSATIHFDTVLKSTKTFYPDISEALEKIKRAQANIDFAKGSFDLKLKSEVLSRVDGYYDGDYFDVVLEKPLKFLNSKVYLGHRRLSNRVPVYEAENETLSSGESRVGIQLSLWRNRSIDSKRLKLRNKLLDLEKTKQGYMYKENHIILKANKAYLNWFSKGAIYKINKEILTILEKQHVGIKRKIKTGALARIYETENMQYITKRKTLVEKSYQGFRESAFLLSLFLRDLDGQPLIAMDESLPTKIDTNFKINQNSLMLDYKELLKVNPTLRQLKIERSKLDNDIQNSSNFLKPKFDLKLEVAKDRGSGDDNLRGEDKKIFLQVEIPIERNLGNGLVKKVKSKKRMTRYQSQLKREEIFVNLKRLYTRFNSFKVIIENTSEEVRLAQIMQKAERKKFLSGGSDFFLLNIRDQALADAKIKLIKSQKKFAEAVAEYKALKMVF